MKNVAFLLFLLVLISAQPSKAIRQGAANANIFIKAYEQSGEFGKLALWHEAAVACVDVISVPLNQIAYTYYTQHGYFKWARRAEKEALEIQAQREYHLAQAMAAWEKSEVNGCVRPLLFMSEHAKIAKFMATWARYSPDRFYEFGIYPTFFKPLRERAEQNADYVKALQIEADAAEMCAGLYEKIPIAYGLKGYEKCRDAYRQHAARLRVLAQQNPKALPPEADKGKVLVDDFRASPPQGRQNLICRIAKSDERVKQALTGLQGIREYAHFQGSAWTVSFYNHGWGNLAVAIVDDKTGVVLHVLKH